MKFTLQQKNENGMVFQISEMPCSQEAARELHDMIQNISKRHIDTFIYVVRAEVQSNFLILHTDTISIPYCEKDGIFWAVMSYDDIPESKRIDDKYRKMLGF